MRPGSIAATVALTAHSGFGELLYPYDDLQTIRRKLGKMLFSVDKRTGAVVADVYEDVYGSWEAKSGPDGEEERKEESEVVRDDEERIELRRFAEGEGDEDEDADEGDDLSVREARYSLAFPPDLAYEHEPLILPGDRELLRRGEPVPLPGSP